MTNIVTLRNTGGFTRMDNSLMEALATVDLPAREFRILMAIARHTIGYQLESKRLSADEIGKLTNMRRDVVSKAISHLLERRVIFRIGGSRGEIGISPVAEWAFFEGKKHCLSETKTSHSAQIVSLRNDASETETATSLLYSKKEPLVTLPSEEVTAPPADQAEVSEQEPKPERKKPFGLPQMLADNPSAIPEQLLVDWIALRKQKRATITPTVWKALNAELAKCAEAGIDAETAMTEALVAGWQGFKVDWLINRLEKAGRMPSRQAMSPDFHSGDTSWADDLGDF